MILKSDSELEVLIKCNFGFFGDFCSVKIIVVPDVEYNMNYGVAYLSSRYMK